jgi:hypothetical protein
VLRIRVREVRGGDGEKKLPSAGAGPLPCTPPFFSLSSHPFFPPPSPLHLPPFSLFLSLRPSSDRRDKRKERRKKREERTLTLTLTLKTN